MLFPRISTSDAGRRATLLHFVAATAIFIGCGCKERTISVKRPSDVDVLVDVLSLGKDLGLIIPKNARLAGVRREQGMDDAVFAKLEIPIEAWDSFQQSAPFQESDLDEASRAYLPTDNGWWDPNQRPGLRATQVNLKGGRVLNIGVDKTQSEVFVVVYAMNHGT